MNSSRSFALILAHVASLLLCLIPTSLHAEIPEAPEEWNAGRDLAANEKPDLPSGSSTELSNPNGEIPQWSYGWRETVGGPGLTLFTGTEHVNSFNGIEGLEGWETPPQNFGTPFILANVGGVPGLLSDELVVHPRVADQRKYVIVRWTAPRTGPLDVVTRWRDIDPTAGDGVDVHIVLNGASIFDAIVPNGGSASDLRSVSFDSGDILDFVVGPNEDLSLYDSTAFQAIIAPEPGSMALAALAGCLLLLRRKQ